MELFNADCFDILPEIKDVSVDLFLLDLPYNQTACKWDKDIIDLEKMWKEIKRIMKPSGIIVFFCTAKFGYRLIHSNPKWFRYDLIWKKSRKVGFLSANKMPLRQHENIYIFKDEQGTYNPQKTEGKPYNKTNTGNNNKDSCAYGEVDRSSHLEGEGNRKINNGDRHPTSVIEHENIYVFKDKQGTYNPQKTEGKPYTTKDSTSVCEQYSDGGCKGKRIGAVNTGDRHPTSIIENKILTENYYRNENQKPLYRVKENKEERHPTSVIENTVLEYKSPSKSLHRTQKPVELCEWLIKTYTNEDDVVCDFCMGSGTVGVACLNTKRQFIGIEKDEEIFEIAYNRINAIN